MALSPQDQEFYEQKLSLKSFGYVAVVTAFLGMFGWPLLFFIQDWSNGFAGRWTVTVAAGWAVMGFLLGISMSAILYIFFKFLLEMGWLPARRD